MITRRELGLGGLGLASATWLTGCPEHHIVVTDPTIMVAKATEAVVIFAHYVPGGRGPGYWLADGTGRCLGLIYGQERIVARFPPGEHSIVAAVSNKSKGARIHLKAGLTYVVNLENTWDGRGGTFREEPLVGIPASKWVTPQNKPHQVLFQTRGTIYTVDEAQCAKDRGTMNYNAGPASEAMAKMLAKNKPEPILKPEHGGVWKE